MSNDIDPIKTESRKVQEIMVTEYMVLTEAESVHDALKVLAGSDLPMLPVVDTSNQLVGVLYDDDLLIEEATLPVPHVVGLFGDVAVWPPAMRKLSTELRKAFATSVKDAMNTKFEFVGPDDSIEQAATIMHQNHLSAIPVLNQDELVGILTIKILLNELLSTIEHD